MNACEIMLQIGSSNTPRVFSLSEARALFPLVNKITAAAYRELNPVRQRLQCMLPTNSQLPEVEAQYEAIVKRWAGKMERLGLIVKGMWLLNFDTGEGYLCWKFPELRLCHYYPYDQDFASRRPLNEVVEEYDPDWARA